MAVKPLQPQEVCGGRFHYWVFAHSHLPVIRVVSTGHRNTGSLSTRGSFKTQGLRERSLRRSATRISPLARSAGQEIRAGVISDKGLGRPNVAIISIGSAMSLQVRRFIHC